MKTKEEIKEESKMKNFLKNMFGWLEGKSSMPEIKNINEWDTSKVTSFSNIIGSIKIEPLHIKSKIEKKQNSKKIKCGEQKQ